MYTSTPADVPDPPFRFFEGLVPRLPRTQALSRRGKRLATLEGQSHLLPLRHGSCDLQRPHPIFENYHVILRGHVVRVFQTVFERQRKAAKCCTT